MKHTQPTYLVSLLATLIVLTAPLHVCAQEQRKTAWGEPDLAGAYTEFTIAPLERPQELGTKEYFTPAEAEIFQLQRLEEVNQDDETEPGTQADVHYDFGTYALSANEGITSPNLRTSIIIIVIAKHSARLSCHPNIIVIIYDHFCSIPIPRVYPAIK